ncbi:hypothetical protein CHOCRA_000185 [Candidatus Hodgkinia cicadicola]|nr:hypothetical protein CHOCRA_000185 [Candidatus Hodgkinia cicadicola]
MITTIMTYVAIQQAIDYLVTSYLRLKYRKQRIQRAREALKNVPKIKVITTAEDIIRFKAFEADRKRRRRTRSKALVQISNSKALTPVEVSTAAHVAQTLPASKQLALIA